MYKLLLQDIRPHTKSTVMESQYFMTHFVIPIFWWTFFIYEINTTNYYTIIVVTKNINFIVTPSDGPGYSF